MLLKTAKALHPDASGLVSVPHHWQGPVVVKPRTSMAGKTLQTIAATPTLPKPKFDHLRCV